jgi:hypothetical protein
MYGDRPYAREVGHVEEVAGVAASVAVVEGLDVPPDVLTGVVRLRKGGQNPVDNLNGFRRRALEGGQYCCNDGCQVRGLLKDFKACPLCKTVRYCGDACQKQDWTTSGHQAKCGLADWHSSARLSRA